MRHRNGVTHGLLKQVPWAAFERLVDEHGAEARVRRLTAQARFVALLYGQLAGAASLREIETAQVGARAIGLDVLTPIIWHKVANGVTETEGNGAGFYGKPYQPGSIVKNDLEYILFLRKGGEYRQIPPLQKVLSMLTKEEMQGWLSLHLDRCSRSIPA